MSLVNHIEAWACEIVGTTNPVDPSVRSLIRQWSHFRTKPTKKDPVSRDIDIGQKTLAQISGKYLQTIHWKAQKAINAHRKANGTTGQLDLIMPEKTSSRAQEQAVKPRRRRYVPEKPYGEVAPEKTMPSCEGYDNFPDWLDL